MDELIKKGKLFHRIKHRNCVAPSISLRENFQMLDVNLRGPQRVIQYMQKMIPKIKERRSPKVAPFTYFRSLGGGIEDFCESCPTTAISRRQEKEILKRVGVRDLQDKYRGLLKEITMENREQFLQITHQSGVEMKLKSIEFKSGLRPYKYLGRTESYKVFLSRRKELQGKFLLHHPLIKQILHECVTNLPYELFNLNQWLKNPLEFSEFQNQFQDLANDSAQFLHEFYRRIVALVENAETARTEGCANYLGACTGLLSVNISRTIAHTLLHVVNFTASEEQVSYLKLNITFDDHLILEPTSDDVVDVYRNFLEQIISSIRQFQVLQKCRFKRSANKTIYLCLTDEFLDKCLREINHNIQLKYAPILEYIKNLEGEFLAIYPDISSRGRTVLTTDLIFEEGCEKILHFRSFLRKIAYIPDNSYFKIGHLILTNYRETLQETLSAIVDEVFGKLSAQHEWENNDICEAFEMINIRATQTPITTEEVIEIGKYMAWVKDEYLNELKERVIKALEYLTKLIQLGSLLESHMVINASAINWLDKIGPILEENNALYEQLKFEAEEKLQHVIEEINVEIRDVYPLLTILDSMDDIVKVKSYLSTIILHMVKIREIAYKIDWINKEETTLSFPKSSYCEFEELKNYVYPFYHLLRLSLDVQRNVFVWLDGQFDLISYEKTHRVVEKFTTELLSTQKVYRNILRQAQDENLSLRFKGTVDDPDMLNWPAPLKLCSKAIKLIQDFEPSLTVIKIMCNEALMKRHWNEMSKVAGFDITPNAGTTLSKIIQMDLKSIMDKFEIISISATKEKELLENLNKMQRDWVEINFSVKQHGETKIFAQLDDIQSVADDHLIKVINMRNSIFVKPYNNEVKQFYDELLRINETLHQCRELQSELLRRIPLFTCKAISKEIPHETKLFQQIFTIFQSYVPQLSSKPNVHQIVTTTEILEDFLTCNQISEEITIGLNNYFEKVREYFPRFFFISNEELLSILSLARNPKKIANFTKNVFPALETVQFNSNIEIISINGANNEIITFQNFINVNKICVEKWLRVLEGEIIVSIRQLIREALLDYGETHLLNWLTKWPSQVLVTVSQILFTSNSHKALNDATLDVCLSQIRNNLETIFEIVRKTDLTNNNRVKIKSILLTLICNKDKVLSLKNHRVSSDQEFKWISLLRYYFEGDDIFVKILEASIKYRYEFLGNINQIVVTPSTERCYHTLITAYNNHLHGICEGETATGKSETVQSLAGVFAIFYKSFKCSPSLSFFVITQFLKGVALSGCWLILENFDKILIETASLLSQEIFKISSSLKARISNIVIGSTEVSLQKCFICLTMKTSKKLPESFKVLFRSIIMPLPNLQVIAEIILFSSGFKQSKTLSNKVVLTLQLLHELSLISCNLRVVKEILKISSQLFRVESDEKQVVYNAVKFVTVPMLGQEDLIFLENILIELFSQKFVEALSIDFQNNVIRSCQVLGLQPKNDFCIKVRQLHESMGFRYGNIVVGKALTGKSTIIQVLAEIFDFSGEKVTKEFINPKAVTLDHLYGWFDLNSIRWRDGIVAEYFRNGERQNKWLIFDGPIDPIWTENLNYALDQKKEICLFSSEILQTDKVQSILFEVNDLNEASPTTISLCGIVYVNQSTTGWRPMAESWISNNTFEWAKGHHDNILALFDWIVPPCLDFINANCHQLYEIDDLSLIKTMISVVEMFLNDAWNATNKRDEDLKNMTTWIQATFIQSGVWGLASTLDVASRIKFDEFYKQLWKNQNKDHPVPKVIEKIEVSIPLDGLIFDYCYVYKLKGNWKFWPDTLKVEKTEESKFLTQLFVPTVDTVKYISMISMHIAHKKPLLLVGPEATGKSACIKNVLFNRLSRNKIKPISFNFTPKISANCVQKIFLSKLHKRKLCRYGPPNGKTAIFFIDDLNIIVKDEFGTRPAIELLRQFFDYQKWYNLQSTQSIYLDDVNIISAMSLRGPNQNLCQRFLRHFNVFSVNELTEESTLRIFSNVLMSKWKKIGFTNDIISTVNQIVAVTYHIYQIIRSNLLPTLNQPLYRFNLRDFSRVIEGCSLIKKESVDINKKLYYKLWIHEVLRVFGDRLIDTDKSWLYQNISDCFDNFIKEDLAALFENLTKDDEGRLSKEAFSGIFFGTYCNSQSIYLDETNLKQLHDVALTNLTEYNKNHVNKLDIVFFDYALEHLSRICRILAIPCSNLLQIGTCGCGRETLVKLACQILHQQFFKPKLVSNYSQDLWRDDIKRILKEAGGYGKQCAFLLKEEVIQESFLEDIDLILKINEIPDLYQLDEEHEILELTRISAQEGNANIDIDSDLVFLHFQKQCKENLHIMLSFSNTNLNLRKLIDVYPSIINYCDVNVYSMWPKEALEDIATTWISDFCFEKNINSRIVTAFTYFHNQVEQENETIITTGSYLEFVKIYFHLVTSKRKQILDVKQRYLAALEKLSYAALQISEMQKSLAEYQPQLEEMTKKAFEMTKQIEKETVEVEKASNLVKQDEKIANEQAAAAQILKLDCEADLAQAIPILEDAISALNTLKPTDITLVKSMKNPPDAIKLVMAAVCVIKDVKPDRIPDPSTGRKTLDYWGPSKRILGDMNFLQTLKDFDKDHIKPEIMVKIRKEYLPHKDFKPHTVAKASSAAEGLCKWIIAMDMYDKVAKEVAPKKEKLEKAEREYGVTMAILNEKKEQVARIEQKLADLKALLDEAIKKQQKLQRNVDICKRKLARAQKLIAGLSEEKIRWTKAVDRLQREFECICGTILICSGIVAYLGPFPKSGRQQIVDNWLEYVKTSQIPCENNFNFQNIFENDLKCDQWYLQGLPNDEFFVGGGIIAKLSKRFCLFIDPQNQANNWVKNVEKQNGLRVTKFSCDNYLEVIQHCMEKGHPVLLENVETLELSFTALIRKISFFQSSVEYVKFVNEIVPISHTFKLYISTTCKNPQLSRQIYSRLVVIDFNSTIEALEDQFLTIVVEVEKPSLKKIKQTFNKENASNKKSLSEIEDKILGMLSESKVDILEDEKSLQMLDESKELSTKITKKQEELRDLQNVLDEFRLGYVSVARYSTVLYFCVHELSKINHMYQFSLEWYINLYIDSIQKAHKFRDLRCRKSSLIDTLTFELYGRVARSIFEKDKLIFAFLICTKLLLAENKICLEEVQFLTRTAHKDAPPSDLTLDWLPRETLNKICCLENLQRYTGFSKFCIENRELVKKVIYGKSFEFQAFPAPYHDNFATLLITYVLSPDKFRGALVNFVKGELDERYVKPLLFDIGLSFGESHILSPLIFVMSTGADPVESLLNFAKKKNFDKKLAFVSVENGDATKFNSLLKQGQKEGLWVCLLNCHLSAPWLPQLELKLESVNYDNTHENFRLWMTTRETATFPISLLEQSIRITTEPPNGIQGKLLDLYQKYPICCPDFYNASCPGKEEIFTRLLYSVSFFHSLAQGRRNFGPYGWNNPYVFSESDFNISIKLLVTVVNHYENPCEELVYLLRECNYGGQASDQWDRRLIAAILDDYLNHSNYSNNYSFNEGKHNAFPVKTDHQSYVKYIESLPEENNTELFGLHKNYEIFRNLRQSKICLNSITSIFTWPKIEKDFSNLTQSVIDLLAKLPEKSNLVSNSHWPIEPVIAATVTKEIENYRKLIEIIRKNLQNLRTVLSGALTMTAELENILEAVSLNKIPANWLKYSFNNSCDSLSSYIQNLTDRIDFFKTIGKSSLNVFWLGGFFNPRSFLIANKFVYSKKNNVPFDEILFKFEVLENLEGVEDDTILVSKLSLVGARWSKGTNSLDELLPKMLRDQLGIVSLIPVVNNKVSSDFYECPIYQTIHEVCGKSSRISNFVASVYMKTDKSFKLWIKRGVALYCQLDNVT